jgi:hypothetical protein
MLELSIGELADITEGRLLWSNLPPLGGRLEPVERLAFDTRRVSAGDVLWCMSSSCWDHPAASCEAFRRGAVGVVGERFAAPWAGSFSLQVPNAVEALARLATHARRQFRGKLIAVAAGAQTAVYCRALQAVLRDFGVGETCKVLRRRGDWVPTGLVNLSPKWDFAVLPLLDPEKESILRLSYPHVAVITPDVRCTREPASRLVLPWLPESGQLIEADTIREAALQVARLFDLPESAAQLAIDRALQSSERSHRKAA